eukprot:CAMPEP_0206144564 /NCGR_PEP_ID=MMETSP1473-20131121/24484_1 /ASSEMBLY_ACC=CAM_ASM_001109 /TAXON_ID=1461547 /ORGANISM="Stichococcus sp, Strain RCC1054" /LENGTH=419 /DNA_ID=CAMNT_0053540415 /DNA_START=347 /DNA_END=1609 /DNA_ORIENTATION=+
MALTVALVKTLNPDGRSDGRAVSIASVYYSEQEGDSTAQKTFGSLINAAIFVGFVTIMTFVLVFLFKRGYTRFIYGYMCFAGFSIFFVMAGIISLQLLEAWHVAMDALSYFFMLYNFAVVGILSLFVWPAPMTLKQGYLTCTGVIVAYVFTWVPQWTTWTLLAAMAIYDLFAVLSPGGPLKELVEIAEERQVDIPALIYEARSSSVQRPQDVARTDPETAAVPLRGRPRRDRPQRAPGHDEANGNNRPSPSVATSADTTSVAADRLQAVHGEVSVVGGAHLPAQPQPPPGSGPGGAGGLIHQQAPHQQQQRPSVQHTSPPNVDEDPDFYLPDAIKLGLGDFIFYSLLVGRAAMYDLMTAAVAYLAIIAGLGATLLLLALYQKALPALPVSIALGISFYFAARFALEPVALTLSTNLVFF